MSQIRKKSPDQRQGRPLHKSMGFFDELRDVARKVEREVDDIRKHENEQYRRRRCSTDTGAALFMLQQKQADIKDMQINSAKILKTLKGNNFVAMVDACQKLMSRNKEILQATETHLEQYGYSPPHTVKNDSMQSDNSKDATSPQDHHHLSLNSPQPPILCTPGIKQIQNRLHPPMQTSAGNPMVIDSPEPPILVTPGLQIRKISSIQQILNHLKPPAAMPVHNQRDTDSPELPILMTPGLQVKIGSIQQCVEEKCNDSPEPPIMQTPGLKQIKKHIHFDDEISRSPPEKPTLAVDELKSPELPEFTSDIGALLRMKFHANMNLNVEPHLISTENFVNSSAAGISTKGKIVTDLEQNLDNFIVQHPGLCGFEDVCDTPEYPDLTCSYKDMVSKPLQTDSVDQTPQPESVSTKPTEPTKLESKFAIPNTPQINRYQVDLPETPQMPELTGSYNFNVRDSVLANTESVCSNKENIIPTKPEMAAPSMQHAWSHSTEPFIASFPEEINMCIYVPVVTTDEYITQPDYVQNLLALDGMNTAIKKLNQLIGARVKAGEVAVVSEDDLADEFSSRQLKVIFLCLIRLSRLSPTYIGGKKFYELSPL